MKVQGSSIILVAIMLQLASCGEDQKKEYFDTGELKSVCEVKEGKEHGLCKEYTKDGHLVASSEFENGVQQGVNEVYYINGAIKERRRWKNGLMTGKVEYFDSLGRLESEFHFDKNEANGEYYAYHTNGEIKEAGRYVEGLAFGVFSYFDSTGSLKSEREFFRLGKRSVLNQFKNYDARGSLLEGESNFIKVVQADEGLKVQLIPYFGEMASVVIVEASKNFENVEEKLELPMQDFQCLLPPDVLLDTLKGYVLDKAIVRSGDSISYKTRRIYFQIPLEASPSEI